MRVSCAPLSMRPVACTIYSVTVDNSYSSSGIFFFFFFEAKHKNNKWGKKTSPNRFVIFL